MPKAVGWDPTSKRLKEVALDGAGLSALVTVDFGSTPAYSKTFSVTVTGAAVGDKIVATPSSALPSGVTGELELEPLIIAARVTATNTVELVVASPGGPVSGQRDVHVLLGDPAGAAGGATTSKGGRASPPSSPATGDVWIVDDDGQAVDDVHTIYRWNGTAWVYVDSHIVRAAAYGYGSTHYQVMPGHLGGGTWTSLGLGVGVKHYQAWLFEDPFTLTEFELEITTGGGAGSVVSLALLKANRYWQPRQLVTDEGTTATAATGEKLWTPGSAIDVYPGRYLVGLQADVAPPVMRVHDGAFAGGAHRYPFDSATFTGPGGTTNDATAWADPETDYGSVTAYNTAGGVRCGVWAKGTYL